ncbi:MAG: DUF1932 domain-containing protein [Desulfocapsaceae bacterium]
MVVQNIGFLHPGEMGISLAATARNSGHKTYWVSHQRSPQTRLRAEKQGLVEVQRLSELCEHCSVIVSVCPPHAALEVAAQVRNCSYKGLYVEVNAISPQHVQQIEQLMSDVGIDFVDGGIIGPPAWSSQTTWLYLSGPSAGQASSCFSGGPLEVEVIGSEIGKASALKMCFAANTKGTTALLCAIMAAAERMGVREELEHQWSRNGSDFSRSTVSRIRKVTAKAWRFSGEMKEISSTFEAAGLPEGFHLAASDIYQRIAGFKDAGEPPSIEEVLDALLSVDDQQTRSTEPSEP